MKEHCQTSYTQQENKAIHLCTCAILQEKRMAPKVTSQTSSGLFRQCQQTKDHPTKAKNALPARALTVTVSPQWIREAEHLVRGLFLSLKIWNLTSQMLGIAQDPSPLLYISLWEWKCLVYAPPLQFFFLLFFKYKFIYFNLRLITLQYCIGFATH